MGRTTNKYYRYALIYPEKKIYARTMGELGDFLGICRSTVEVMKKDNWNYKPPKVGRIDFHIEEIWIPIYKEIKIREPNPFVVIF